MEDTGSKIQRRARSARLTLYRTGLSAPSADDLCAVGLLAPSNRPILIYFGAGGNILRVLGADVAELADALDSKSGARKGMWVRPPPSAPTVAHQNELLRLGPYLGR